MATQPPTHRNLSRQDWIGPANSDDIDTGSLQRIADACEKMASNYTALQNDRDMYHRWYREQRSKVEQRDRTIIALRGQITKLKRKLADRG